MDEDDQILILSTIKEIIFNFTDKLRINHHFEKYTEQDVDKGHREQTGSSKLQKQYGRQIDYTKILPNQ